MTEEIAGVEIGSVAAAKKENAVVVETENAAEVVTRNVAGVGTRSEARAGESLVLCQQGLLHFGVKV